MVTSILKSYVLCKAVQCDITDQETIKAFLASKSHVSCVYYMHYTF